MASNYPTSLDNFSNPSGTDSLNSPSHSLQHSDINDAVEAIEAKLGIGASPAGSATAGQVLTAQGGGTAIWATPALVHIDTQNPSGVSSISFNDVFSATYDDYFLIIKCIQSTTANFAIRLRASGSDNSSSNYVISTIDAGAFQTLTTTSTTLAPTSNASVTTEMKIFEPFLAVNTKIIHSSVQGSGNQRLMATTHTVASSFDGFSIIASAGTLQSGSQISLYGFRK